MENNKAEGKTRKEKLKSWCWYFFEAILIMFLCLRYEWDTVGMISMLVAGGCLVMIIINAILMLFKK